MKYFDSGYSLLIYLAIFVIGSIISAIKKKADAERQKPVQNTEKEHTEPGDPWKEIFEKAFEEHKEQVEKREEIYEEKKEVQAELKTIPLSPKAIRTGLQPIITNYNDLIKDSEISNIHEEQVMKVSFNVREAVIYSEILNRKYF